MTTMYNHHLTPEERRSMLIWQSPYRGKTITLQARRNQHWYQVDGYPALMPSVTTILSVINKPALLPWAKKMALQRVRDVLEEMQPGDVADVLWQSESDGCITTPNVFKQQWIDALLDAASKEPDRIKDEAADYGTLAHQLIDQILKGIITVIPPLVKPALDGFARWQEQTGIRITASEIRVFHPEFGYAGSVDWIGWRGDRLVIGDWKTSNGLWDEYGYQLAGYAKAIEALTGIPVAEAWGVRFPKVAPLEGQPAFEALQVADLSHAWSGFLGAYQLWQAQRRDMWLGKEKRR